MRARKERGEGGGRGRREGGKRKEEKEREQIREKGGKDAPQYTE